MTEEETTYAAFAGQDLVASGDLKTMLTSVWQHLQGGGVAAQVFVDQTGQAIDFDFRGTLDEVLARAEPHRRRPGPGRPRLGVVSREVSLLPRHWEWLEQQRNGISSALRRLVDEARRREPDRERARRMRDAAGRFMWGMAGDLPGFEEASRALFAGDQDRFEELVGDWPRDIHAHLLRLTRDARRLEGAAPPPAD